MKSDGYWFGPWKGPMVHIGRSSDGWGVWLDGTLLCDGFRTPEDAAACAHDKAFKGAEETRAFARVWVPAELSQWKTSSPEQVYGSPNHNN